MKRMVVIIVVLFLGGCEIIQATAEECKTAITLAQAVVDRDLAWNQILVCDK